MSKLTHRLTVILPIAALTLAGCTETSGPRPEDAALARVGATGKPTAITACGTVITTPGKYRLGNSLTSCNPLGVAIRTSGVTLLLDGHDITGTGPVFPSPNVGIDVGTGVAGGVGNVSIQGPGTVSGFGINIQFEHVVDSRVLGVTSSGGFWGIVLNRGFVAGDPQTSSGNLVQDNAFQDNRVGVSLNGGDNNTIRGNTVFTTAPLPRVLTRGIHLFDARGNDVIGNTVTGGYLVGIFIELAASSGNRVHGNTATGNATDMRDGHGDCASNQWTGNTFVTAFPACIR